MRDTLFAAIVPLVSMLALSGCASNKPASVEGECRVFTDPGFAVQGKRLQDKRWVAGAQEAGIAACGWQRPVK